MPAEPDFLTKWVVTVALFLMAALHLRLLTSAAQRGLISYYFWSDYNRKTEPAGFWICVGYNLVGLLFFIWVLGIIALDFI